MPRRFALALLGLLVLLLLALLLGRRFKPSTRGPARPGAVPTARPTPATPPTPIPARRVALYFESPEDGRLHAEARDLASSRDDVAFLRSLSAAVLDGPRRPELLHPFPEGWRLRGAYRLKDGLVVLDLDPPARTGPEGASSARWETGSHEEESAAETLLVTLAKNLPDVLRVVLLVGGEPVETLAGHLDLTHPLHPDVGRASDDAPLEEPTPTPVPTVTATPSAPATPEPAAVPTKPAPRRTPRRPAAESA